MHVAWDSMPEFGTKRFNDRVSDLATTTSFEMASGSKAKTKLKPLVPIC